MEKGFLASSQHKAAPTGGVSDFLRIFYADAPDNY